MPHRLGERPKAIERGERGRVLHAVDHVVERLGERADVLAVDRRDEGLVEFLVDAVADEIGFGFDRLEPAGDLDELVVLLGAGQTVEFGGGGGHLAGQLFEQGKKAILAGQQESDDSVDEHTLLPAFVPAGEQADRGGCPLMRVRSYYYEVGTSRESAGKRSPSGRFGEGL